MTAVPPPDPDPAPDAGPPRRSSGRRANALAAASFVALGEVDPRVIEPLLESLEDAGVAAYAEPSTGQRGGYLDVRLPSRPAERLYADSARRQIAEAVVAAELPGLLAELEPVDPAVVVDEEARFAAIVASWDAPADTPVAPWPTSEDVDRARRRRSDETEGFGVAAVLPPPPPDPAEEHFVPQPPPPLPKVHPATKAGWAAIALGLVLLVGWPLLGGTPTDGQSVLGIFAVVGGVATLVWRMRDVPPVDDGPDDGAVV